MRKQAMTIEFGNRLQELRKSHGYSQEELADKLEVSRQAVSKWECGEASPDTDNLIELARIYNISLDELVGNRAPVKEEKECARACEKEDEDIDEDEDEDEDEDDIEEHKRHSRKGDALEIALSSASVSFIIIAYILLGSICGLWGQAWTLFLLIPVIPSLIDAIRYKDAGRFLYPVFVAFVYLTLGAWFPGGLWHPYWFLFLTIPVFYGITEAIKAAKKKNCE